MNWFQAKIAATPHLEAGENLRWVGTPSVLAFAASRVPAAIAGLFICWAAVSWMSKIYAGTDLLTKTLAQLPIRSVLKDSFLAHFTWHIALAATALLLALGVLCIVPLVLATIEARRTVYAVTDRRVFVLTDSSRWFVIRSRPLDPLIIDVKERRGGRGDLHFLKSPKIDAPAIHEIDYWPAGFFGIASVRDVEELIAELKRGLPQAHPTSRSPTESPPA